MPQAARTLGTMASTLAMMGVQLIVTHLVEDKQSIRLLAAHGLALDPAAGEGTAPGTYRCFPTLHEGMVFCETQYLKARP